MYLVGKGFILLASYLTKSPVFSASLSEKLPFNLETLLTFHQILVLASKANTAGILF